MPENAKIVPIYTTPGDWEAILRFPYLYNRDGEWIGWVTSDRDVFDVDGIFVGQLTDEPRILRRRLNSDSLARRDPPPAPERLRPPASAPLPPMMPELPYGIIDVLDEEPDRLHTLDHGNLKEDMD